jgi:hypothetical protein
LALGKAKICRELDSRQRLAFSTLGKQKTSANQLVGAV